MWTTTTCPKVLVRWRSPAERGSLAHSREEWGTGLARWTQLRWLQSPWYLTDRWFTLKERFRGSRVSGRTGSWRAKAGWSRLQEDGKRPFSGDFLPCALQESAHRFGCPHGFARTFGIASYTNSNLRCKSFSVLCHCISYNWHYPQEFCLLQQWIESWLGLWGDCVFLFTNGWKMRC